MKKNWLSLFVVLAMLLGMVSSAAATPGLASSVEPQTGQPPTDDVVARVYFTSQDDLNSLASRNDILEVNHEQNYIVVVLSPERYAALQQAGYRLEIDESKTKLLNQPNVALPGQGPDSIPGFPCYRTVEETYTSMLGIATANPDMAELIPIGMSWDMLTPGGPVGYDILALRLTNENFGVVADKPTFFLMAEIHAREYATAEMAMRYAEYLINNYGIDPDATWLLDYFRVYIVTMTNPDGRKIAEGGDWWRKNVDNDDGCTNPGSWGTDLNRNSSFKWAYDDDGSSPYACDETYRGPGAASEPETQAIQNMVLSLFADQRGSGDNDPAPSDATGILVSLHSAAALVLWPWGWTGTDSPNHAQLQTLGRHLAYFNSYTPQQSNDLYATNGTTDDWSYGELGIASFTFEMAGEFFQPCGTFEATDYPDNRDALLYAFKSARHPYMDPAGPDSLNLTASPAAVAPGDPILLTASANGTRYAGGEPTQNISAAQYTIDSPSWITGTVTYPMTASDGSFNNTVEGIQATIDTTGLSAGRHTIFVESKDVGNDWGVLSATFIYIIEPGVSPVIEGYVLEAGTNAPLDALVTAGLFNATTDPATGYYSMTVVSDTYDMVVTAANYAPAYANDVVAQDYQTIQKDFLLYPVCTLFSDDVESGPQGWTAQSPWAITTEASHSPTHSWTDSPGGNYNNYRNISLTSQVFDLSAYTGVTLSFWHTYMTEPTYDFGYVEYSTDGVNWSTVASYDGNHPSWSQEQVPVYGLDGQANARIRFRFFSDTNVTADGWHIDDIAIVAGGPGCMPPSVPVAGFTSNSPVPLGQPMLFTNETTGSEPITYTWNFGDGVGSSSDINPSYTYAAVGTYTVTLVATNTLGADSISHPVTVEPAAIASVDLTQVTTSTVYAGDTVDFSADLLPDNAGKPYTYTIDYGDGTVITATSSLDPLSLSHTFTSGGNYTIQIWVSNAVMTIPVTDSLDLNVVVMYKIFLPNTVK